MEKKKIDKKAPVLVTRCTEAAGLHVREAAEGEARSRTITGYAILFNTPSAPLWSDEDSEAREVILPEAITKELLDGCDIKFTMFHDRQLILARSKNGEGTLSYNVDEKGVSFEFEAPETTDGEKALELVRRGDLAGCSFAFSTHYWDATCVDRSVERVNNRAIITYKVKSVDAVYDFTLAADPAYPDTSVTVENLRQLAIDNGQWTVDNGQLTIDNSGMSDTAKAQIREMRAFAKRKLY